MSGGYHLFDCGAYTVSDRKVAVTGKPAREINFTANALFTDDPAALAGLPVLFLNGDYLDCDARWPQMSARWATWSEALSPAEGASLVKTLSLPDEGISGNRRISDDGL